VTIEKNTTYTITATDDEIEAIERALTAALRATRGEWRPGYEQKFKQLIGRWLAIAETMEVSR
jgi:hypothetical protein